ncbi:MAG TPA: L,D-transpeptidase [Acidobacteriota bacterium]|nr:L,D-transpeptidase [Acidobacteriota bacterium]
MSRRQGRGAAALLAALVMSACAAGPQAVARRPGPPRASEKPGGWGTTIAVYDASLYGPERPLSLIVNERHLRLDGGQLRKARLLVNKAQRRLELWVGRRMIKAYRVQLGWRAHGAKERLGDQRTPEGAYFICAHRPSAYSLGLWLAYPNADDARRGLATGLIAPKVYEAILNKIAARACPPQDTRLGGAIIIHGQLPELTAEMIRKHRDDPASLRPGGKPGDADPAAMKEFQDWTDGCVALFDPDIRELYEYVPDGAEVIIVANAAVTRPRPLRRR